MGILRRFAIPNDCLSCSLRRTCDFCNLPQPLMSEFNAMGHLTLYPSNATLLAEGEMPRGVYIACSGRSKLSVESRDGKTIILKIAGDRQLLGLSAVVSGGPSPITVTTIELCDQVCRARQLPAFDRTRQPRRVRLRHHARARDRDFFDDVHELLLARSSTEKLARLLLSWVSGEPHNRELRVPTEFTHEEIAQMIGSSRETVTRLLSDLKRKDLIRLEGATLVIPNRIALQAVAC